MLSLHTYLQFYKYSIRLTSLDRGAIQILKTPAQVNFKDLDRRLCTIRLTASWEGLRLHAMSKLAKPNELKAHKGSKESKILQIRIAKSKYESGHDGMDKKLSLLSSRAAAIGECYWRLPQHLRQKSTA